MQDLSALMMEIPEPEDYFHGIGARADLPTPRNVLLFVRKSREALQQNALSNRSHHRFVLAVCLETAGDVHVDHRVVRLEPGRGLLIPPHRFHHYSHLQSSRLLWGFCTFEMREDVWTRGMPSGAVRLSPECMNAFRELTVLWATPTVSAERLQTKVLESLLLFREAGRCQETVPVPEQEDSILGMVNRLLLGAEGGAVGVEDLAGAFGLSVPHFRLRFRSVSGVPLGRYLENFRLNRAMDLLKNSREPVGTIAIQAGYASPQAFHRAFKRLTGETPLDYRRRG
jgi:AraC-like DNA-binding protein